MKGKKKSLHQHPNTIIMYAQQHLSEVSKFTKNDLPQGLFYAFISFHKGFEPRDIRKHFQVCELSIYQLHETTDLVVFILGGKLSV